MMGFNIGLGNIDIRNTRFNWAAFWAGQSEVLFFGEVSKITSGKLYNQKSSATDYLTVTGTAGSYTFQCPNTAPYIAADTDYIWFKTDTVQRIPMEVELVGYDFTRTIVKYDNITPYAIRWIMILSSDLDTNNMRDSFDLSVWWDNTLSAHGNIKGNRGSGRSVWNEFDKFLSHFDGVNNATAYSDLINGAWTFYGPAKLTTTAGTLKFGSASLNCTPNELTKITTPASSSFYFGSNDFTLEFWVYPIVVMSASTVILCAQCDSASNAASRNLQIVIASKKLWFGVWDNTATLKGSSTGATNILINQYYHIALVRYGNTITLYLNGIAECTLNVTGVTLQNASGVFALGFLGDVITAGNYPRVYFDEFRISKGIARWTANFTPPTAAYSIG